MKNTLLFKNINEEEYQSILNHLHAFTKTYKKNNTIISAGEKTSYIGYVLKGSVSIESNDIWGHRTILSHVSENDYFLETYALLKETLLVDVISREESEIMFLDMNYLNNEEWSMKLIHNLLEISTRKNLLLSNRSFHTAPKTIREKVMAYLNTVSLQKNSHEFYIPFNRQELADYLNVDRTALSKELSKMQKDHLIDTHKNYFRLYV